MQISVLFMMLCRRNFCPAAVPFQDVVSVFKHARDSPFLKRFDVLCINFKMNSEGVPGCLWMLMGACACLEHGGFPLCHFRMLYPYLSTRAPQLVFAPVPHAPCSGANLTLVKRVSTRSQNIRTETLPIMDACACLQNGGFPLRRDKSFLLNQHVSNISCRDNT